MDTKEKQILVKVRDLMFRLGIKSLTMDDIAQQLGISKKTLYQVVENKADLVGKIMDLTTGENAEHIDCILREHLNAIDEMYHIYQHNSKMAHVMHPGLLFELRKYFPESYAKLEVFRANFIESCVSANVERGMREGLFRENLDSRIIAKLYTARVIEAVASDMFPADEFPRERVLHEMFHYHIRGIASAKGLSYLEERIRTEL